MRLENINLNPFSVLMIEDNECDIEIMSETFERYSYPIDLHIARNAEDGLAFLNKKGRHSRRIIPNLIFLDLNLPNMHGLEFLDVINVNPNLRAIPVIVMTTSTNKKDIISAYQKCANCYVNKPIDMKEFQVMITDLTYVWLRIAESPIG